MKKITTYWPIMAMMLFALTFASCKKAALKDGNDYTNTKDANGVSNAVDATSDDATAMAGQVGGLAGKKASNTWYMLCGSTVVDTGNGRTITVTYDSTTICNGVKRSGTVVITLASGSPDWSQQGAVLNVAVNNVKVTDVTTQNSFTLNGNHTITNETGGLAWQLFYPFPGVAVGTVIKHRDKSSNMTVTFSDGTSGSWSVDRTRIWSRPSSSGINFEITSENTNGEDTWGTNRYGESFNTNIATPIEADNNPSCPWRPYQGKYVYNVPSRNATANAVFGTDGSGTPDGSSTTCAQGYYLTYTLTTYNYNYHLFVGYW